MAPHSLSTRLLAGNLGVSPSSLNRILKGIGRITPAMALRLSKALGRSPVSWLAMQSNHDLWQAQKIIDLHDVTAIRFVAA